MADKLVQQMDPALGPITERLVEVRPGEYAPEVVANTPAGGEDVNLTAVGGGAITLGQATKAASLPVARPSDDGTYTVIDAVAPTVIGTILATGEVVRCATAGYDGALVTYNSSGYTGNNSTIAFEFSDDGGTTWFATQGARTDNFSAAAIISLSTPQLAGYYIDAPGATHVRVRSTVFTVGGTAPTVRLTASTATIFSSMTVGAMLVASSGTPVNVVGSGSLDGIVLQTCLAVMAQQVVYDGSVTHIVRTPSIFKPLSAVSITSETAIWTPAAGKRFRLMGYLLASSAAGNVTLRDNTGGTLIHVVPCGVAGAAVASPGMANGQLSGAINQPLTALGPATAALSGVVFGTEE